MSDWNEQPVDGARMRTMGDADEPAPTDARDAEIARLRAALEVFADPASHVYLLRAWDRTPTPADFARKALDGSTASTEEPTR